MPAIDAGVRDVVALFNSIPGVRTRASCEGTGGARLTHRHANLAYVILHYPFPLALQDFLLAHLDAVARIDPNGVYSRWPACNREFLSRLADAMRAYQASRRTARQHLRIPLATLRARLAHHLTERVPGGLALCTGCAEVVLDQHREAHTVVPLLHVPGDQALQWFSAFLERPGNRLDPQLLAREGWESLIARTHRGDFGAAFYRRWLRHRSRQLADLTTHQLGLGVAAARRRGSPIDFYFDGTHAHFEWE